MIRIRLEADRLIPAIWNYYCGSLPHAADEQLPSWQITFPPHGETKQPWTVDATQFWPLKLEGEREGDWEGPYAVILTPEHWHISKAIDNLDRALGTDLHQIRHLITPPDALPGTTPPFARYLEQFKSLSPADQATAISLARRLVGFKLLVHSFSFQILPIFERDISQRQPDDIGLTFLFERQAHWRERDP